MKRAKKHFVQYLNALQTNFIMIILQWYLKQKLKLKQLKGTGLKLLTRKQMLQRLPIALAQVKVGNNSESLLNEIRQIVYS